MQTITLNLTAGEVNLIIQALAKLPFETVNETIINVRRQAIEQLQATAAQQPETPEAE